MAQLGTALVTPYEIGAPERVAPNPGGGLSMPYVVATPDLLGGSNFTNRFPTPPIAWGFLIEFQEIDDDPAFDFLAPKQYGDITGALTPEGIYLEPTIGQIWPR